jgi:hypothetical protein
MNPPAVPAAPASDPPPSRPGGSSPAKPVTDLVDTVSKVLFRVMGLIVRVAPLGVLGAVAYTVGQYGVRSLEQLVWLVGLFWVSVAFFVVLRAIPAYRSNAAMMSTRRSGSAGLDMSTLSGHRSVISSGRLWPL